MFQNAFIYIYSWNLELKYCIMGGSITIFLSKNYKRVNFHNSAVKRYFHCFPFSFCRRTSELFDCYPKIEQENCFLNLQQVGMSFFHFGGLTIFLFNIFSLAIVLLNKKKVFCKLKKNIFLRSLCFFDHENVAARVTRGVLYSVYCTAE